MTPVRAVVEAGDVADRLDDVVLAVGSAGLGKTFAEADTIATDCSSRVRHKETHSLRVPWRAMTVTNSCCYAGDQAQVADENRLEASCR